MEKVKQIYTGQALIDYAEQTFKNTQTHIEDNNWRTSINLNDLKIDSDKIKKFSWNRTKKFNKRLDLLNKKKSVRSLNYGFHYIFKRLLETSNPVKIKVSEKEELIQSKRKKWKEARDISDKLLEDYKKEKGNFYKK